MRRGSVIGPLILIGIGVLFLFRNLWPDLPVVDLISRFWPFLLIAWGAIRLVEIVFWAASSRPIPRYGVTGGEWVMVVLICIVGGSMHAAHRLVTSFPAERAWRGVVLNMGENFDYTLPDVEKPCAQNCRIVIEGFRGSAKITGVGDSIVKVGGRETIRTFQQSDADSANKQTPLELIPQGDRIIVRTNQDRVGGRMQVTANLEITAPAGSSIEAHGRSGDFDVQGLGGGVEITSDNAGVRLEKIAGNVKLDLRRSDAIRAVDVKGNVELKAGRGNDVELQDIGGTVTMGGTYVGDVHLKNLAKPLRYEGPQFTLNFEKLPGQVQMESGEFTADNVIGPVRLSGRSRDVQISDFTQSLDLTLDRGDIRLRPGKSVPKMEVHTRSGDIDLALEPGSKFDVKASTDRGEAQNEYGEPLTAKQNNRGGTIEGVADGGPVVRLETNRGSVTIRKSTGEDIVPPRVSSVPLPPKPPLRVERQ